MYDIVKVGIVGCGNISEKYLNAAKSFPMIKLAVCADLNMDSAKKKADEFDMRAVTVDELLDSDDVEIVLNLTNPNAHTAINLRSLESGKHVYCEKPFAVTKKEGMAVLNLADEKGLLVGGAPDTFLGGGLQTCRKIIDEGVIGRPVAGTAFMMNHGHEGWHPNAGYYYQKGGGPMLDMGPYYITALVHLLGAVKRVSAITSMSFSQRVATCEEIAGKILPVDVQTHLAGTLEFHSDAIITIIMSFDVWKHSNHHIELHCEHGSLQVPDPNCFDGPVRINKHGEDEWKDVELSHGYTENMRSIGLADMAWAIRANRKHRCSGELTYHILEVMEAFEESSASGKHISIESTVERPAALPVGLKNGLGDE